MIEKGGMIVILYILLAITVIVSCLTCIMTIMLEKNEMKIQEMDSSKTQSLNLLSKTVDITKTIEILDLYDDGDEPVENFSQEPVIIAVLDENAK